jgi:hypothetical protein
MYRERKKTIPERVLFVNLETIVSLAFQFVGATHINEFEGNNIFHHF